MRFLVIDGQGGRLGCALLENIRKNFPDADITGVGINSAATAAMMRTKCADRVATGENAVVVCSKNTDVIACPIGIALANSLLGEVTPRIAYAVATSSARRVLIPMNLCDTFVAGVQGGSAAILESAMEHIRGLSDPVTGSCT